jgi:hypothetical protein
MEQTRQMGQMGKMGRLLRISCALLVAQCLTIAAVSAEETTATLRENFKNLDNW